MGTYCSCCCDWFGGGGGDTTAPSKEGCLGTLSLGDVAEPFEFGVKAALRRPSLEKLDTGVVGGGDAGSINGSATPDPGVPMAVPPSPTMDPPCILPTAAAAAATAAARVPGE